MDLIRLWGLCRRDPTMLYLTMATLGLRFPCHTARPCQHCCLAARLHPQMAAHLLSSSRQTKQLPAAHLRRCVTRINRHKSLLQTLHVPPLGGRLLAW